MSATFTTIVLQAPGMKATGLPVPDNAVDALGTSKKPSVVVHVGEYTYRSTVSSRYGGFIVPLSAEHRTALGVSAGDSVEVTLELDTEPRDIAVPPDLASALDAAGVRSQFDSLCPSKRGGIVTQIEAAKAEETRAKRVAAAVTQLA
jgi:hypothetical protein